MTDVYFTGPLPAPGEQFCIMCVIQYKTAVLALPGMADRVQALVSDGKPGEKVISLTAEAKGHPHIRAPQEAVATAVSPQLGNVLAPLCWSHVQAMKFTQVIPGRANAAGVPLLGNKG